MKSATESKTIQKLRALADSAIGARSSVSGYVSIRQTALTHVDTVSSMPVPRAGESAWRDFDTYGQMVRWARACSH